MSVERHSPHKRLDILVYQDGPYFIGHCIQFNLATTADTKDQAFDEAIEASIAHLRYALENDRFADAFHQSPREIMEMFEEAEGVGEPRLIEIEVERPRHRPSRAIEKLDFQPAFAHA